MKAFLIDLKKCTGCYDCQVACKDEHCGNDWSPYAKPQPTIGQFWMHVTEQERGQRPHVKVTYLPVLCQHCDDAPCAKACASDAISQREDGIVIVDPEKCTGCKACVNACPFDAVFFNDELNIAQKCTGCSHLVDRGWPISEPRCVNNCHTGALSYGEEAELDLEGAEQLRPELGLTTQVWYKNVTKKFIAGTVYDPETEEIIEGAQVRAFGEAGEFIAETDEYGDFWLRNLPDADWTVEIAGASKRAELSVSTKQKDVGLPDIPLA